MHDIEMDQEHLYLLYYLTISLTIIPFILL